MPGWLCYTNQLNLSYFISTFKNISKDVGVENETEQLIICFLTSFLLASCSQGAM